MANKIVITKIITTVYYIKTDTCPAKRLAAIIYCYSTVATGSKLNILRFGLK